MLKYFITTKDVIFIWEISAQKDMKYYGKWKKLLRKCVHFYLTTSLWCGLLITVPVFFYHSLKLYHMAGEILFITQKIHSLYYKNYSARLACNSGWGSYSEIKISKLKNIHIPHIGVPEFCLDWVFKMPVHIETR